MKIEEQVLSIEQMKHLQELGVDTSDASMHYRRIYDIEEPPYWELEIHEDKAISFDDKEDVINTYTIGDLIEKLPKRIGIYHLMIDWDLMQIEYLSRSWQESVFKECFNLNDKPLINTLYDCLCWIVKTHKELLEGKK